MDSFTDTEQDEQETDLEGADDSCVFCQIAQSQTPTTMVYSDDDIMVINDINPQAPVHMLVLPKRHIESLSHVDYEDVYLLGQLLWTAKLVAEEQRLDSKGYKLFMNVGSGAGQTVPHIHLHLLGGRPMKEFTLS